MKRSWHKTLAFAGGLFFLAGCVPLRAETRIEKDLALEEGGTFVLEADAGSVDLTGSPGSGAHIVISSKWDDFEKKFDVKYEESAGMVRVVVKKKGVFNFSWFSSSHSPNFEIRVPTRTQIQIKTGGGHIGVSTIRGDAVLDTSGGHIEVTGLHGKLHADTSGGHITLRDIEGNATIETSGGHIEVTSLKGDLKSETSGGHIELRDVTGDIETSTSGGGIQIAGAGGRVSAETSGGSVEVAFAKGNARGGRIESSGGGITVNLDPNVNLVVDAETSGGTVSSELPLASEGSHARSSLKGQLGKGGETLLVRTSAGPIRFRRGQ